MPEEKVMQQPFTPAQMRKLAKTLNGFDDRISAQELRGLAKDFEGLLLERLRSSRANAPAETEKSSSLEQQAKFRERILFALQERTGIFIEYPRSGPSSDQIVKGSRVETVAPGHYGESNQGIGTALEGLHYSGTPVMLDDGRIDKYPESRIHLAMDSNGKEQKKAEAMERASGQSFENFKLWLAGEVEKAITEPPPANKVMAFLSATFSSPKFKNGTRVIVDGNKLPMYVLDYQIDRSFENAEGTVVGHMRDEIYAVRITEPKGRIAPGVYPLWAGCLKKTVPLNVLELIDECVNGVESTIGEEKERAEIAKEFPRMMVESGLLLPGKGGEFIVNRLKGYEVLGSMLAAAYANPALYSSPDMFSPPSERKPHVLRLELAQGCDYGRCTYCWGYKGIPYRTKSYDEFVAHYYAVIKALGEEKGDIRRIFIGGANALSVDTETLEKAIRLLNSEFRPRRIALYGRADSINEKGKDGLEKLRAAGLDLIYLGVESGAQKVLDYVRKGTNVKEMILAGYRATDSSIKLSVMIMPGLGGIRYAQAHVDETVRFLNEFGIQYITLMGVNPPSESKYALRMQGEIEERINRPLTDLEIVEQVRAMLEDIRPRGQRIGMFECGVDKVGHNPISFEVRFDERGKKNAIAICDEYIAMEKGDIQKL